jgi:arginyl-tRNA synthetase
LFRATDFGDDSDRPVQKADGSWTYFAADIAYLEDKLRRGFTRLVMTLGADHGGYVTRLQAALRALDPAATLDVRLNQMVQFVLHGEPWKMSKRAGTYVAVADVLDAVGKDVLRFMMLTRKNDVPMVFDIAEACAQSQDNPVFYVQYAYARAASVLRHAGVACPDLDPHRLPNTDTVLVLISDEAKALLAQLALWPRLVAQAAVAREPHRVVFYMQDVAKLFHAWWTAGKSDAALRLIQTALPDVTHANLCLVRAMQYVLASGFRVCGVAPREELYA